MLYELRVYEILPGRMPAIDARFREHTLGLFKRHDIGVVGFWHEVVGSSDRLVYITRFDDMADRERKWNAFVADPDWQRVRSQTEADGPIVRCVTNRFLAPTEYSPRA
jgi:hypothetical protein